MVALWKQEVRAVQEQVWVDALKALLRTTVAIGLAWAGLEAATPEEPAAENLAARSACQGPLHISVTSDEMNIVTCLAAKTHAPPSR